MLIHVSKRMYCLASQNKEALELTTIHFNESVGALKREACLKML